MSKRIKKANDFTEFWVLDNSERASAACDPQSSEGAELLPLVNGTRDKGLHESLLWTKIGLW